MGSVRQDPNFRERYRVPDGSPRGPLADIWDAPAVKVLVRHERMADEEFRDRVVAAVGDAATATWSVPGLVEISASGVTKATALTTLCRELGVPAAEVIAFGDMPNDLPMLAWAGRSYAMANAHQSVLDAADFVVARLRARWRRAGTGHAHRWQRDRAGRSTAGLRPIAEPLAGTVQVSVGTRVRVSRRTVRMYLAPPAGSDPP